MAVRVPPVMRRFRSATLGRQRLPARLSPRRARIFAFVGLLGPGLIAANAGNDAGGVATYASAGAKYGYDLLWLLVLITLSLAIVQMLAARMGVVTGKGLAERSEEHTSELQSLRHLVCRLLLEKKNKRSYTHRNM